MLACRADIQKALRKYYGVGADTVERILSDPAFEGVRFEVPSRFAAQLRLTLRYALDHPERVSGHLFTNSTSGLADSERQAAFQASACSLPPLPTISTFKRSHPFVRIHGFCFSIS